MENTTGIRITKRDYEFAIAAGLLIGLLLLPVLKTAKPELFAKFAIAIVPFFLLATPLGLRIAFLFGKKIAIIYQIAKFGLIGVLNTLVDLGVLALITLLFSFYFQIEAKSVLIGTITFYSIYKAASFIIANISSYFWNKYWTFDQGAKKQTKSEFMQFFAVSIVGFLINVFVASFVFKTILGSATTLTDGQLGLLGAAAGSIAGLAWNFIGYKLWVFKK
ncbi:MAG: GtrA family protein [Candidatus Moranbacteria bacterium]|nr:GtrA family protein [Candidatus Moranbacteria bacterium]